jgi:hypothetical protein
MSGSSAFKFVWLFAVAVVAWLIRLSRREDLLRLCLEVRLSSNGFMSGGSCDILRKITPRYMDSIKDTRCMHPLVKLTRNVEYTILVVAWSLPNRVVQWPGALIGSIDCV